METTTGRNNDDNYEYDIHQEEEEEAPPQIPIVMISHIVQSDVVPASQRMLPLTVISIRATASTPTLANEP